MVKRLFITAIAGIILYGCNNDKQQEKAFLNKVLSIHDKVMADDGVLMKDESELNSLEKKDTSGRAKDSAIHYMQLLSGGDDQMMAWMNRFNPDFTGKSHAEIMDYLGKQKKQVTLINRRLDSIITASNRYITKIKAK